MKVLYAFYDLKVSPCTYDIVNFLYLAEMRRLKDGLDAIDLVVVANDGQDIYRDDEIDTPKKANEHTPKGISMLSTPELIWLTVWLWGVTRFFRTTGS